MDTAAWIKLAMERMCEKEPNSLPFELKDLFSGDEWNTLTTGEKTMFGKVFASLVRKGEIEGIRFAPIGKNSRHNKNVVY